MRIRKSAGPETNDSMRGHCYDGPGWQVCDFWAGHGMKSASNPDGPSRCLLFGGTEKHASEALRCCDKLYGLDYEGEA